MKLPKIPADAGLAGGPYGKSDDTGDDGLRRAARLGSSGRRASDLALAYHVTTRLSVDCIIAATPAQRRIAARTLYEQGEPRGLVAFGLADTHLHALLSCTAEEVGRFSNYVGCALRWRLGIPVPFETARVTPVLDQRHLY